MANVGLLKLTLDYIKLFPEKHDQGDWVDPCNSTMCFAGHAAMLAGATFKKKIWEDEYEWLVDPETGKHTREGSEREYVQYFAARQLGLTEGEADYLFHQSRTPEQIEKAVEMLSEGYTVDYYGNYTKKAV